MVIKRAAKALVFWFILLVSGVNGFTGALAGDPTPAVAWLTAIGMLVALVLWAELLHRIIYGRVFGRADLEKLSPIRPAASA